MWKMYNDPFSSIFFFYVQIAILFPNYHVSFSFIFHSSKLLHISIRWMSKFQSRRCAAYRLINRDDEKEIRSKRKCRGSRASQRTKSVCRLSKYIRVAERVSLEPTYSPGKNRSIIIHAGVSATHRSSFFRRSNSTGAANAILAKLRK